MRSRQRPASGRRSGRCPVPWCGLIEAPFDGKPAYIGIYRRRREPASRVLTGRARGVVRLVRAPLGRPGGPRRLTPGIGRRSPPMGGFPPWTTAGRRHHRVGPGGLDRGPVRGPRQPRAAGAEGRRRRRPADAHDRGRELPGLPRRRPRPRAHGAHGEAGRRGSRPRSPAPGRDARRPLGAAVRHLVRRRGVARPDPDHRHRRVGALAGRPRRGQAARAAAYPRARPATGSSSAARSWSSWAAATRPWRRRCS